MPFKFARGMTRKESEGSDLQVPGEGYASPSKFVGDNEAAYFLPSVSFILGSDQEFRLS